MGRLLPAKPQNGYAGNRTGGFEQADLCGTLRMGITLSEMYPQFVYHVPRSCKLQID